MAELDELAAAVAARARRGEQVEAYVARQAGTTIRAYAGEIEHLSAESSAGIGVRVVSDHRQGFSFVSALDEAAGEEALKEARDNASFASPDEHAGLAVPDGIEPARLELWRPELQAMPTEEKTEIAIELERLVRSGDSRIRQVVRSDYEDSASETAIATSTGIFASWQRSSCHLFTYAVAGEGDETQTGFSYSSGRQPGELDLEACAADAVERATRMLGATKPQSAQLTAVFDRRVTATLLAVVARALSGEEVAKKRSLFANRVGEQVGEPVVTLTDDPSNERALGATPFDAEGLATRRNELVEGGKLMGYLYDTRSGRMAGAASTASAVRNGYRSTPGVGARAVYLAPGELDQAAIVSSIDEGIFIQSVSGVNSGVNPVSGDFSLGAEGLMIRDGELAEPVREMTIASTLQRMLQHVRHVGSDLEWLPGPSAGLTLAVDGISLGGK